MAIVVKIPTQLRSVTGGESETTVDGATTVGEVLAAVAEIGGAWLVWQGVREHRGLAWVGAGTAALGAYGFVATLQEVFGTHTERPVF